LRIYLVFGKILTYFWQIFNVVNGQILNVSSSHLVTWSLHLNEIWKLEFWIGTKSVNLKSLIIKGFHSYKSREWVWRWLWLLQLVLQLWMMHPVIRYSLRMQNKPLGCWNCSPRRVSFYLTEALKLFSLSSSRHSFRGILLSFCSEALRSDPIAGSCIHYYSREILLINSRGSNTIRLLP